ncbi:MAG: hypothetical protein HFH88_15135, partial [Lachnospiraceae bacterium]|nr:hypothetical protein [Lachnospiraceae bacterium]
LAEEERARTEEQRKLAEEERARTEEQRKLAEKERCRADEAEEKLKAAEEMIRQLKDSIGRIE